MHPRGGRERGLLPMRVNLIDLGAATPDMVASEVPRYRAALELAMSRLCHGAEEHQGYRLNVRYPPITTRVLYRHVLPEPRAAAKPSAKPTSGACAPR